MFMLTSLLALLMAGVAVDTVSGIEPDDAADDTLDDTEPAPVDPADPLPIDPPAPDGRLQEGTAGDDMMHGGPGGDTLRGHDGRDDIFGAEGDDLIEGGADGDWLDGLAGADTILGGDGSDSLAGHFGDDHLDGGDGHDAIYGGEGDDTLLGGAGLDSLLGNVGHDMLQGGLGRDEVLGGEGRDTLSGSDAPAGRAPTDDGRDFLNGGQDDDLLLVGAGDWVEGNEGADQFLLHPGLTEISRVDGEVTRLADYDPAQDQIIVGYDPQAGALPPTVTVEPSEDGRMLHIVVDGQAVAQVDAATGLRAEGVRVQPLTSA